MYSYGCPARFLRRAPDCVYFTTSFAGSPMYIALLACHFHSVRLLQLSIPAFWSCNIAHQLSKPQVQCLDHYHINQNNFYSLKISFFDQNCLKTHLHCGSCQHKLIILYVYWFLSMRKLWCKKSHKTDSSLRCANIFNKWIYHKLTTHYRGSCNIINRSSNCSYGWCPEIQVKSRSLLYSTVTSALWQDLNGWLAGQND